MILFFKIIGITVSITFISAFLLLIWLGKAETYPHEDDL